ncbi:MAG TPA: thioredoxin domain-containing protein, partial [Kofleriaceae bacterium]
MPNRLAVESSPYLRQHADNPVEWWPWCEEAFAEARQLDKPVFVSIGYAACHWCHVMAHESFEDPDTARLMNARFVNIKVDREERPDVDAIFMNAIQVQGEGGGWPLSAFCLPDGRPFYLGTYFPPEPRFGRPSFRELLLAVSDGYRTRRADAE